MLSNLGLLLPKVKCYLRLPQVHFELFQMLAIFQVMVLEESLQIELFPVSFVTLLQGHLLILDHQQILRCQQLNCTNLCLKYLDYLDLLGHQEN